MYNLSLGSAIQVRDISFDWLLGRILLTTKEAPVLMSTLENEKIDAWRQYLARGKVEEAYRSHQTE